MQKKKKTKSLPKLRKAFHPKKHRHSKNRSEDVVNVKIIYSKKINGENKWIRFQDQQSQNCVKFYPNKQTLNMPDITHASVK